MRPEDLKKIIKAGIFLTFTTLVCMVFVMMLGKNANIFQNTVEYLVQLKNASNLKPRSMILLNGVKVGQLKKIQMTQDQNITLTVEINAEFKDFIREDSYISIKTQGMLGDKYIEILGGSATSPMLAPGQAIKIRKQIELSQTLDRGQVIIEQFGEISKNINNLIYSITENNLFFKTVSNFNEASSSLKNQMAKVDVESLNKAVHNFNKVMDRVNNGPGTLNSIIYQNTIHDDLKTLLGGAHRNKVLKYFIRETIKQSDKVK